MSILLDKISDKEYIMLDNYRNWYAWDCINPKMNMLPIRELLTEWAKQKENLYHLLGDNLIIKKEFEYEKDIAEIELEVSQMLHGRRYGRYNREGVTFIKNFQNWVLTNPKLEAHCYTYNNYSKEEQDIHYQNVKIKDGLYNLISYHTLSENVYKGDNFTIELNNGKNYTISKGCKPVKTLCKIAQANNIAGFEDFRLCHSQIHNQKKIKGTMCLSIHPLDFWTMSDNECGWDSCMNWRENGGYRQGTVEMMNSPSVLIAYLESNNQMYMGEKEEYLWSNKKWRELFIADKDIIFGIKDYPYHNSNLGIFISNWLKELSKTNMNWEYTTEEPFHYNNENKTFLNKNYPEDSEFSIHFLTQIMYNDVGSMKWHPLYLGKELTLSNTNTLALNNGFLNKVGATAFHYHYSGESQCMHCGKLQPYIADESCLVCNECEESSKCEFCGARSSELYTIDGIKICDYCINEQTADCNICDETHLWDNTRNVFIIPRLKSKKIQKRLNKKFQIDTTGREDWTHEAFMSDYEFNICDDCWEQFNNKWLKPDAVIHRFEARWDTYSAIYYDELNEEGQRYFDTSYLEDLSKEQDIDKVLEELHSYDMKFVQEF